MFPYENSNRGPKTNTPEDLLEIDNTVATFPPPPPRSSQQNFRELFFIWGFQLNHRFPLCSVIFIRIIILQKKLWNLSEILRKIYFWNDEYWVSNLPQNGGKFLPDYTIPRLKIRWSQKRFMYRVLYRKVLWSSQCSLLKNCLSPHQTPLSIFCKDPN